MQIVEYTEAVDLTMHGMRNDIYVMHPVAIKDMTLQDVRAAAEAGAVFALMQPDPKEKGDKDPKQDKTESAQETPEQKKAEQKDSKEQPVAVLDHLAGYGSRKKLDTGKMTALRNAGWSYKKIADEMGCSEGTVWNFFNRGGEDEWMRIKF